MSSAPLAHRAIGPGSTKDDAQPTRRTRDYTRIFKACDTCRRKKTRCILDAPEAAKPTCRKCKRERRECSLSKATSFRDAVERELSNKPASTEGSDSIMEQDLSQDRREGFEAEPMSWHISSPAGRVHASPATTRAYSTLSSHSRPSNQNSPLHTRIPDFNSIASVAGRTGENDATQAVIQASISNDGDTLRVLQQSSRHQENLERQNDWDSSHSPSTQPPHQMGTFISEPSHPSSDILRLWNSLRFVRMGWLTANEAVSYIDLFFQNLAPLSPVLDDHYSYHENHYSLITQEPLLCCTILMISSRFHSLRGTSSWSRSVALHDRLWEHCEHLVTRIIFGQEKKSKAKTRTLGAIQALMLMTEWAPRAVYFPPKSDGWDSDLIFQLPDDRDQPGGNEADVTQDIHGNWFRDVIAPARIIDRMSWMLLGCAVTLGHEIGIFDVTKAKLAVAGLKSPEQQQSRMSIYIYLRKVIYVADEHFSNRLGSTSLIPSSLNSSAFEPLPEGSSVQVERKRIFIEGQLALARLAKSISSTLFSSTAATRELIQSYKYVSSIEGFQQQLLAWRETYLDNRGNQSTRSGTHARRAIALPQHAYELLAIEYQYNRIFLNSLGMQAAVDRSTDLFTKGQDTINSSEQNSSIWFRNFATSTDLQFVLEVIDGGCQILQSAIRLANTGTLRYCPTRVIMRVIAASVFLLKALGLGVERTRLEASLNYLQCGIEALRNSTWDDVELASRYAAVLDLHIDRYKRRFVTRPSLQGPMAAEPDTDANSVMNQPVASDGEDVSLTDVQDFQNPQDWLSIPLDISMAPFGVHADESAGFIGLEDGDWSFLWNLPSFPD